VAVIGPNGAGKTTLLHLIIGLAIPSAGSIKVFGCDPRRQPRQVLPRVGFVGQNRPLYRNLTVADTVEMGRRLNPVWDVGFVKRRLVAVGIDVSRKVGTLSGGQHAQVALTLALGKRPELLVLDEPLEGLDPVARVEFLGTVAELSKRDGVTVVFSSHIVSELETVCDDAMILDGGRIVAYDSIPGLCGTGDVDAVRRRSAAQPRRNSLESAVLRHLGSARARAVADEENGQ
jgi:ABC-2 type transport system ATP-binding protein